MNLEEFKAEVVRIVNLVSLDFTCHTQKVQMLSEEAVEAFVFEPLKGEETLRPMLEVERTYQEFCEQNESLGIFINKLLGKLKSTRAKAVTASEIEDWEIAKSRLTLDLFPTDMAAENDLISHHLLKDISLGITYVAISTDDVVVSFAVPEYLLSSWGVTKQTAFIIAFSNTPRLHCPKIFGIREGLSVTLQHEDEQFTFKKLNNLLDCDAREAISRDESLVVTSATLPFGAICLLFRETIEWLKNTGAKLMAYPFGRNEAIVLKCNKKLLDDMSEVLSPENKYKMGIGVDMQLSKHGFTLQELEQMSSMVMSLCSADWAGGSDV